MHGVGEVYQRDEKLMVRNSNKEHQSLRSFLTHHQISSCLVPPAVQSSLFGMLPLCTIGLVTAFDKEVGLAMLL